MYERDLLVAAIAIGLGLVMFVSSAVDAKWLFEIRTPRYLSEQLGRGKARLILSGIGAVVILLGIYILFGPKPDAASTRLSAEPSIEELA